MKYSTAVVACTAILSASTVLAAPRPVMQRRGNVLSKPSKGGSETIQTTVVKTDKRSIDDLYFEARGPETGKAKPKPKPQPIVQRPEEDPRLKFIGGNIPGERVKRSFDDFDFGFERRGNVLSKPVKHEPVKSDKRSFDDLYFEARGPETGKPKPKPKPQPVVQEDPRLQFTGGDIPGQRRKKPIVKQPEDPRLQFTGGSIPGERVKRSLDDFDLERRGNVLSKPVKPGKRSIDDFDLERRGNVLSKPVKPKPKPQPKPEEDPRLQFVGGNIPGERVKRSIDDFDLEVRGNALSKPVKPGKRSIEDLDFESREYIEDLVDMIERALETREFDDLNELD